MVFVSIPSELSKLFAVLGLSKILRSAVDEESALSQLAPSNAEGLASAGPESPG